MVPILLQHLFCNRKATGQRARVEGIIEAMHLTKESDGQVDLTTGKGPSPPYP